MYYFNYLFDCEYNYVLGGIVLGVVAVVCGVLMALALAKKMTAIYLPGAIVSFVCIVVTSLLCYNELFMIAFWIALVAFSMFLALICQEYHKHTIYEVPFTKLFFRMFFPVSVATLLFRPWFSQENGAWYRILPGFGMDVSGTYVYDVTVLNASRTDTVWNIISAVQILLFITVLAMQVILIWREFADPDNAGNWATIGMFVTCIGCAFIYGVYTSPNFMIATTMEASEKLNLTTGEFETVFKAVAADVDYITMAPIVAILLGAGNRLFYFDRTKKAKVAK